MGNSSGKDSKQVNEKSPLLQSHKKTSSASGESGKSAYLANPQTQENLSDISDGETDTYSDSDEPPQKYDPLTNKDLFFRDGKKRIDFVLVYESNPRKIDSRKSSVIMDKIPSLDIEDKDKERERHERDKKWRLKFLINLKKVGLDMEEEVDSLKSDGNETLIYYIKLHAPWDVLCVYAEELMLRAPLEVYQETGEILYNTSAKVLKKLKCIPNFLDQKVPNTPPNFATCQFRISKLDRFYGIDKKQTFFNSRDRARIVNEILATTAYGSRKNCEIGIERLLEEKVFTAAFSLHDGAYDVPKGFVPESLNPRQILYEYWASWEKWYKYQPLDHIREYFGEKIAIYFAWLGFYTTWLLPYSIVGFIVFLYGVLTVYDYVPAQEACDSEDMVKMCPLCDEDHGCEYYYLSELCVYVTAAYLFDHGATVFFATVSAFWAVLFLEYWKRRNAELTYRWDCFEIMQEEERPRPQYAAKCHDQRTNGITGVKEPYFLEEKRIPRILSGTGVVVLMLVLVLIFIMGVIMYRILVTIEMTDQGVSQDQSQTIANTTSAILNLVLILALGLVYEKLALRITEWEMHRTQSEYEDQLTFKVFIFQFVNFYASLFYIAFFKGRFSGYPGSYNYFFGLRQEECRYGGCLIELAIQLAVVMIGNQTINNMQEFTLPKFQKWWYQRDPVGEKKRYREDYALHEHDGLFYEYLEMVIQYGFITIFVAAFPLAPMFALLNNWIEIRLDARKLVTETRRPIAEPAQSIGVWYDILEALSQLAVICNAFLIAFTSDFLPKLLYKYQYKNDLSGYMNFTLAWSPNGTMSETCRYKDFRDSNGDPTLFYWELLCVRLAFVIVFQNVVYGVVRLIAIVVPDIPESLNIKIKRERYLARQALADTDALLNMMDDEDPDLGNLEGDEEMDTM